MIMQWKGRQTKNFAFIVFHNDEQQKARKVVISEIYLESAWLAANRLKPFSSAKKLNTAKFRTKTAKTLFWVRYT